MCDVVSIDTLTDVSSLNDLENDDTTDDDALSQSLTDTVGGSASPTPADNLSDLTIPDFSVSFAVVD